MYAPEINRLAYVNSNSNLVMYIITCQPINCHYNYYFVYITIPISKVFRKYSLITEHLFNNRQSQVYENPYSIFPMFHLSVGWLVCSSYPSRIIAIFLNVPNNSSLHLSIIWKWTNKSKSLHPNIWDIRHESNGFYVINLKHISSSPFSCYILNIYRILTSILTCA